MRRRTYLRAGAAGASLGLAGCLGILETRSSRAPPLVDPRPEGVYVPTHVEGMQNEGVAAADPYRVAVLYSFPHRFWTVTGSDTEKVPIEDDDAMHLMAVVWDAKTGTVVPETGLSIELRSDGDLVSEEVVYPMLSQRMGFHYGGNFAADGDGVYTATVSVGEPGLRTTGALRDRLPDATATVELTYSESEKSKISFRRLRDRQGNADALKPMSMGKIPAGQLPKTSALPGTVLGRARSDDADFVATVLDDPPEGIDADRYLAVSARSRYNRYPLARMGLSATVRAGGTTVFDGDLTRTLDPDLGYHYGVGLDAGDSVGKLSLRSKTPPQVARHEGYETAFLQLSPVTIESN